jgi:3-oxoacyl-[acyl-carrier-protein] synthase-1
MIVRVGALGMVTPVGLSAAASLAAMRAGINLFQELPIPHPLREPIMGAFVPTVTFAGLERLLALLEPAVREASASLHPASCAVTPLLIAVPHPNRPGVPSLLRRLLLPELQHRLGWSYDPHHSALVPLGRAAGLAALGTAVRLLRAGTAERCLVAGADSLINEDVLGWLYRHGRLKIEDNSNGLIPGEAAVAIELVSLRQGDATSADEVLVLGHGEASETALVGGEQPNRADGLVAAVRAALAEAGLSMDDVDYRLSDVTGEHYYFKETANGVLRLLRRRKQHFPLWHPADVIGDSGAAASLVLVAMACMAARKGYAPGKVALCQASSDEGHRAACVLQAGPAN